jgi:hypothetical protein
VWRKRHKLRETVSSITEDFRHPHFPGKFSHDKNTCTGCNRARNKFPDFKSDEIGKWGNTPRISQGGGGGLAKDHSSHRVENRA